MIGGSDCDEDTYKTAYRVGELLAENNCIVINGGLGGVMEASAKGARSKGGTVIGILPYSEKKFANPFIDIKIVTNMGHARNVIIAHSSDAVIAIDGGLGTISEIAIALKEGKRVVGLNPPIMIKGMSPAENAEEAVKKALEGYL